MCAAGLAFLSHLVFLSLAASRVSIPSSNLIQLALGILAVLAMLEAARRSSWFARRNWLLAALAMGAYTAGQGIVAYYGPALSNGPSPIFALKDQLFFFWMVPLLAAASADPRRKKGFDWTPLLDFAQLVVLALALHLVVFGDAGRWHSDVQQMSFLKWKVRVIRDAIVLACLWGRHFASPFPRCVRSSAASGFSIWCTRAPTLSISTSKPV